MIGEQFDMGVFTVFGCPSSDAMISTTSMATTLTLTHCTSLFLPRSSLGSLLPERVSFFRQPLLRPGLFAS